VIHDDSATCVANRFQINRTSLLLPPCYPNARRLGTASNRDRSPHRATPRPGSADRGESENPCGESSNLCCLAHFICYVRPLFVGQGCLYQRLTSSGAFLPCLSSLQIVRLGRQTTLNQGATYENFGSAKRLSLRTPRLHRIAFHHGSKRLHVHSWLLRGKLRQADRTTSMFEICFFMLKGP